MLPSTVQSAISYSSMGGGNVAASVVGAALSNLAGIVLTPALVALVTWAQRRVWPLAAIRSSASQRCCCCPLRLARWCAGLAGRLGAAAKGDAVLF
jgi:hypothetical protein